MSQARIVLMVLAVVAPVAYVLARPSPAPKEFVLAEVANKTMCPIDIVIDEDLERIPQRIKFLKCAERPNKVCGEQHMSHGCCKHHHHSFVSECVEIYDWVQVRYKGSDAPQPVKVPVGCTCLIEETTQAAEAT